MKIYLATGNRHKLDELAPMFPEHQIVLPSDEGIPFAFEENGTTYFENCFGKAQTLFDAVRAPVLADDSGLSVFCLGGAPGIYSARYGKEDGCRTSGDQIDCLLKAMESEDDRRAAFVCCLTMIFAPYRFVTVQETVEGVIGRIKSGSGGFGYDPVFYPTGSSRSFAGLSPAEKAAVSHRGKAAAALRRLFPEMH